MTYIIQIDGRLGEGEPAVADFQTYLAACAALGYQYAGPELRQLYDAEHGLDLRALDADCRALAAAADAADDVIGAQNNAAQQVAASWSGAGGVAAGAFLRRHGGSARSVVAGLRQAADALAGLRDELSRAVEAKVSVVLGAADWVAAYRGVWTSAAHAVLGGAGDQAVASEIVDQQVKPFVDQVLRGEVLPALQKAADAAAAAFDSALAVVTGRSVAFELLGDFGAPVPTDAAGWGSAPTIGCAAASAVPSSWAAPQPISADGAVPATASPAAAGPAPAATLPAAVGPPVADAATPSGGPAPALPTDLGLGSAAGGFGRQLADALGGVLGSAAGLVPDSSALGDLADGFEDGGQGSDAIDDADDDPDGDDDADTDDVEDDSETDDEAAEMPPDESAGTPPTTSPDNNAAQPRPEETPPGGARPPVPVNAPDAAASTDPIAAEPATSKTPCQIAADELPQVGD